MREATTSLKPRHDAITAKSVFVQFVLFDWWQSLSRRISQLGLPTRTGLVVAVLVIGIAARLWAQTRPSNFDFGVWLVASQSVLDGNNPYELDQFNYGPTWLGVITGLQYLSSDTAQFRLLVGISLTAVDVGVTAILIRKGYILAAIVFFLSPIAISISGQHQQIDNLAILVALIAVMIAGRAKSVNVSVQDWWAILLIGFSLSIKHVFLLFPVWLFMRPGSMKKRLLYLIGPYAVFGISLLFPFLSATDTVSRSMLQYSGANNSPVLYFLLPDQMMPWVLSWEGPKVFFALALVATGFFLRRTRLFEFTLLYTLTAVVFSWSIVNQYLAVPMAAVAIWMNLGLMVWLILASVYLLGDPLGMNVPGLNIIQPHLLLEYNVVAKDLFLWLFLGWILVLVNRKRIPELA